MSRTARVVVAPAEGGPLVVRDALLPDPAPHQVVVQLVSSGVCHSQVHQLRRRRQAPLVLGHEASGVVVATGTAVSHVSEGDRVLLTWVPRAGDRRRPEAASIELDDGTVARSQNIFTWADVTIADEQYVVKATREVPLVDCCIVGCAVMTGAGAVLNTAGVQRAQSVAVIGAGGVGLSAIAAARLAGALPVIAVDLNDEKLALAAKFGATNLVNASRSDPVAEIRAITEQSEEFSYSGDMTAGADFAFDCIGLNSTMSQAVASARRGSFGRRRGGTAVLVGAPTTALDLDARDILVNEKAFIGSLGGSCSPDRDFPVYLRWIVDGDLDIHALVTDRFTLDRINSAVSLLEQGDVAGRAIIEMAEP